MAAYRDMLGNILLHLPAAAESRSYVVMEEVKETAVLDLEWFNYIKKGRLKVYNVQTTFFQNTFYTHDRNTINQDALKASNPSLPHQAQAFPYQPHKQKKCTHSIECVPSLQRRNRGEKSSCIKQLNGRYYLRKASFCQIFICKNFLFFEKTADFLIAKCQVIALFFLKIYINQ